MPRYGINGDLLAGPLDGWNDLTVNRVAVGSGGGRKWLNASQFLANATPDGGRTWGLYVFTGPNWTGTLVNPLGASRIAAGNNNWAATLESNPPQTYGWFNNQPLPSYLAAGRALDGSVDGGLLFASADYSQIWAQWPDGNFDTYYVGTNWINLSVRMLPDCFLYYELPRTLWLQRRGQTRVAIPVVDSPFEPTLITDGNGLVWVLYHNEATYLHPVNSFEGYKLPASYAPDIRCDGQQAVVVTSPSPSEVVTSLLETDITLGQNTVPLAPGSGEVTQPQFDFHHDVLVAPFKGPVPNLPSAEKVGIFSESASPSEDVAKALATGKRVCWCHDAPTPVPVPLALRPACDQIWLECYRMKSETLAQSEARWAFNLDGLLSGWSGIVGIIPMMYGQGGLPPNELWTVQEILDGLRSLSTLVNRDTRIQIIAPFAYQRGNGIVAHPELQTALDNIVAASPGVPIFTTPPSVVDPPVRPPIEPPVTPPIDPPIPPPSTGDDMYPPSVQPSARPTLTTDNGQTSEGFATSFPLQTDEGTAFQQGMDALRNGDDSYAEGAVRAHQALTQCYPDVNALGAIAAMRKAAQGKGKDNYGQGYTDMWRCYKENLIPEGKPNAGQPDVEAVIARQ